MPLKLITHLAKLVLIPSLLLAHSELQAKEKKRAQVLWGYCGHQPYAPPAYLDLSSDPLQAPTHLHADEAEGQFDASYTLQGNVKVWRGTRWIEADHAHYDSAAETAGLQGNVRLGDLTTATSSDRGTFNFITQQGRVENSHYRIYNHHARGSAQTIIFDGPTRMQLKFAQFTTCDEDSDAWYINSQSVRLDQESGLGTAAPVYITFYHVPILFSPYIYFPIDDRRQTGFLVPSFKTSSISGTQISTPFYINLDPQYDLTVTPRNMTRRGLLVENEFRYLLTQGNGSVQANFLQSDNIYNEDRYLLALQHSATPAPNWLFNANLSRASDKEYLNDFGNDLNLAAATYLEQRVELTHSAQDTVAALRLQGFYILDKNIPDASLPYRRLPQLTLDHRSDLYHERLSFDFTGELVRLDQNDRISTNRLDLSPALSVPFTRAAGFIVPKMTLRQTNYELYNLDPDTPKEYSRTLPVASLDSGLYFERDMGLLNTPYVQTLEPRLFYLNVPYHAQAAIPVFDSSDAPFSYAQLFREDRFNGADRVGDTQQVSVTLTSRLIDLQSGVERTRASIGQIFYIEDRRVGLNQEIDERRSQSDIVGEIATRITDRWSSFNDALWNQQLDRIDKGSARLRYQDGQHRIFNAGYRWTRTTNSEQTDFSTIWPLGGRWQLLARRLYDHRENIALETLVGLEYNSCCWALRALGRRHVQDHAVEKIDESIMVQLELKGLGNVGTAFESLLEQSIPGVAPPE